VPWGVAATRLFNAPHKICPRQAMSRPRERARPLIPITIEHADCLHRFSTASPVDKLAVDRRRPPCIRKVQTVALAVVPEKATKWSPARGPRPLRRSGPDAVRNDGHPGEPGELPSGDQTLAGWWHAIARRPGASATKHRDHRSRMQEGLNRDTPGLDARHKIISHGQDHRGGSETRQGDRVLKCRVNRRVFAP
jgi:hypothetical protein